MGEFRRHRSCKDPPNHPAALTRAGLRPPGLVLTISSTDVRSNSATLQCLLPFVDDPARGIERIQQLLSEIRVYGHQLGEVVEAVGHSRNEKALPFLLELASDKTRAQQLGDSWINAIAALDTPEARNLLLSFVDPKLPGLLSEVAFSRDGGL